MKLGTKAFAVLASVLVSACQTTTQPPASSDSAPTANTQAASNSESASESPNQYTFDVPLSELDKAAGDCLFSPAGKDISTYSLDNNVAGKSALSFPRRKGPSPDAKKVFVACVEKNLS